MTCIECGAELKRGPVHLSGSYRGHELSVFMEDGLMCSECGYSTIHGKDSGTFAARLKDKYREAEQRLDADGWRDLRSCTGLSQADYAELVGIGVASVKRCEKGHIPEQVIENYARLKSDPWCAEIALQDSYFQLNSARGTLNELHSMRRMVSAAWASGCSSLAATASHVSDRDAVLPDQELTAAVEKWYASWRSAFRDEILDSVAISLSHLTSEEASRQHRKTKATLVPEQALVA